MERYTPQHVKDLQALRASIPAGLRVVLNRGWNRNLTGLWLVVDASGRCLAHGFLRYRSAVSWANQQSVCRKADTL